MEIVRNCKRLSLFDDFAVVSRIVDVGEVTEIVSEGL